MKSLLFIITLTIFSMRCFSQSVSLGADVTISQMDTFSISPVITGGSSPYQYSWNTSTDLSDSTQGTVNVYPLETRTYTLTVKDHNNVVFSDSITVNVNRVIHAIAPTYRGYGNVNLVPTWSTGNQSLDSILNLYGAYSFKLAYPFTTDPVLGKYYYIKCHGNVSDLVNVLDSSALFDRAFEYYEFRNTWLSGSNKKSTKKSLTDSGPDDYEGIIEVSIDKFSTFAYDAIKIKDAWAISKGGADKYKVGVYEQGVWVDHPDLTGMVEVSTNYGHNNGDTKHGTRVVGLISAHTDNNGGISGVGYNTHSVLVNANNNPSGFLEQGLDALEHHQVRVLSNSWYSHCLPEDHSDPAYQALLDRNAEWEIAIKALNSHGMVVIFGAGNGYQNNGANGCPSGGDQRAGKAYPTSLPGVISVSGSNPKTQHPTTGRFYYSDYAACQELGGDFCYGTPTNPLNSTFGYQYNADVDVIAPGMSVTTTNDPNNTSTGAETGQYYIDDGSGTSFATPIVAGVAVLMLNANPCLSSQNVESILKRTAHKMQDDVSGYAWHNKLGGGMIDAGEALKMATGNYDLVVENGQELNINNEELIYKSIRVKTGGKLHITNSVIQMAAYGKIRVEPGAELIASDCQFKSGLGNGNISCSSTPFMWEGIEVQGLASQSQTRQYQGFLNLTRCTLEQARNAVVTYATTEEDEYDWDKCGGGWVICYDNTFKNCKRAIAFHPYYDPNNKGLNNKSSITRCTFLVNGTLNNTTIHSITQITTWGVKGVRINGCTFDNQQTTMLVNGILTWESNLIVQDAANILEPSASVRGQFKKIYKGVESYGTSAPFSMTIHNNDFFDVFYRSISLKGDNNSLVYRNNFEIASTRSYAIYADYSSNYIFALNNATGKTGVSNVDYSACIVTTNSDFGNSSSTQIKNKGEAIHDGFIALQNNSKLNYYCNINKDFNTNHSDNVGFRLNPDNSLIPGLYNPPYFGSCDDVNTDEIYRDKGNAFFNAQNLQAVLVRGFEYPSNKSQWLINTSYPGHPDPYWFANITGKTSCIDNSGSPKTPNAPFDCDNWISKKLPLEAIGNNTLPEKEYPTKHVEKFGKTQEALGQIARGNELYLVLLIQYHSPGVSYTEVLDSLLSRSPYLSDEVLVTLLQYGTYIPDEDVVDILVLHSPLSAIVKTAFDNVRSNFSTEDQNRFDDAQVEGGTNLLTSKIREIEYLKNELASVKNSVIATYLYRDENDTLIDYVDSLLIFLESSASTVEDHMQLANMYLWFKDTSSASDHINIILDNPADSEVTYFKQWAILYSQVVGSGRNWFQLDSSEVDTLYYIASSETRAGFAAMGILQLVYGDTFERQVWYEPTDSTPVIRMSTPQELISISQKAILYPNPATDYLSIDYSFPKSKGAITFDIYSISGAKLKTMLSEYRYGKVNFDTQDLPIGTYVVQIRDNYKSLKVEKFVISR